jgi:polyisoprenyl-teichoic acid--peptidoglycan teichoic acid transferase
VGVAVHWRRVNRLLSHRLQRSAAFSAALSFLLPGLGQGASGAILRGTVLAIPVLVLVGFGIAALGHGGIRLAGELLQPGVIVAILVVDGLLLVYRGAVIVDAYLLTRRLHPVRSDTRSRGISIGVLAVLLLTTLSMHAWLGVVELKTYNAIAAITSPYGPNGGIGELPSFSPSPTPLPGETPGAPTPTPSPTPAPPPPWAADGRLNLLLVGGDAGPGRWSLRTDTMILASVDVATGRTALFGIPRNLVNVPLPPESAAAFACRCFPQLLNALYVYAGAHPELFPGGDARGYLALQGAVSALTGVQVDGMLVVDLNGFVRLVNALGGININVPYAIYDPRYPLENGSGDVQLYIRAGQQHMDGHLALAYARTRHQDDDYHRMERQQQVLLALRQAVNPCSLIPRLPELIDIAGQSLWTDLAVSDLPDILALAARVSARSISRYAFDPPAIPEYLNAAGVAKVRAMVANAFRVQATPTPGPAGSGAPTPASSQGSIC